MIPPYSSKYLQNIIDLVQILSQNTNTNPIFLIRLFKRLSEEEIEVFIKSYKIISQCRCFAYFTENYQIENESVNCKTMAHNYEYLKGFES